MKNLNSRNRPNEAGNGYGAKDFTSFKFNPNAQQVIKKGGAGRRKGVHQMKISEMPECQEDVQKYCHTKQNNFAILDCLQSDLQMEQSVSVPCQHVLWVYKRNLTMDSRFDLASKEVCDSDINKIDECRELKNGAETGFVIPCLIENIENVTAKTCQQYLAKMATIVFSDYRLVHKFVGHCKNDIEKYHCGRLDSGFENEAMHNQGKTIDCLAKHMSRKSDALEKPCKKQLLRTLELQSDDFHLDRKLYYACHEDREHFCKDIISGGGKIYDCLYLHLSSKEMSTKCRERLELRQRLIAEDVKIDKIFYIACRDDIEKNDCSGTESSNHDLKRATILLCLETAVKKGKKISKCDCIEEMKQVRSNIMEDFNINPDILVGCKNEIDEHCSDRGINGQTIHCLMSLANVKNNANNQELMGTECKAALRTLIEEADVASDISIDKAILKACKPVIKTLCSDEEDDGSIMNCLMENIDDDEMTNKCEERLIEIQYFIVRDFRLDAKLYRKCRKFAKKYCKMPGTWWVSSNEHPQKPKIIFACLYRKLQQKKIKVTRGCRHEVRRVMRERAKSVDLAPEIEESCLKDLGRLCSDKADLEHGEEMVCLQDNYDEIQNEECKKQIGELTEDEDEDYTIDTKIMKACTPMIKNFCNNLLEQDSEPADVLECLIEHKQNSKMDSKCAAGIEHHQLISLKHFKFNHKFKESCQADVKKYCERKKTKFEVVSCLSEHVRNDTLFDKTQRISKKCRKQLRVELLQREESITLDPVLSEKCKSDVLNFCKDVQAGNSEVIKCLKRHQQQLSDSCHKIMFKRQRDQFAIADYGLATACKRMIEEHCADKETEVDILECLKRSKNDANFDNTCRTVILRRQISQSKDYRLNPQLSKMCQNDIPKFCRSILDSAKNDEALEGKVINCLKHQYAIKRLSKECAYEVGDRVKEAASDIRMAPQLTIICKSEVSYRLAEASPGQIQECLKKNLLDRKLSDKACMKEVAYLIEEGQIDVNVDPLLNDACQLDIVQFCRNVEIGEGKIMSCLLSALEDSPTKLHPKCHKLLSNRKQMWEYAAQVAPPESFQEVYESITQSPAKTYFLGVLAAVVALIFIIGISCGRVTKRVRAELKNR
ncbi:hypothetical protein LOTGIDRAFT_114272 [Lottia gigantea]|uniref:Golgi apparatus protein 1 n=1 Tax=Lottia gigantea TaxID=225164 RepID=V4ATG9_LOTGI|nr:hypothetical protein LOTGIDRAFT_114272 [Lottia gigantea]ESO98200.1 hypothetical protein LOTGIDRAFT_114272 [Lottia gigantea]